MLRMSRLSSEDRLALIVIARRAISSAVLERCLPDLPACPLALTRSGGAFVTLHRSGRLRGCVGQVEHPGPLAEVVARAAMNAALNDPRFGPVTAEEVPLLEIEISVLSPLEPIRVEEIVAGQHGLMVVRGRNRGLLLPQVASERKWNGERFLQETCEKAGLPGDAWRDPATQVYGFTAEVFSEAGERSIPKS